MEWYDDIEDVLPQRSWSKSGAPLYASNENQLDQDYLFWGDSIFPAGGIGIALGQRGLKGWKDFDSYLLQTREEYFDSKRVEAGPSPVRLNTGDYLFLYNSARGGYHSVKPDWDLQYNIGYAILARHRPTQVLQRSDDPIMSPTLEWEIGNSPTYLTPNVVYLGGLIPDPDGCQYVDVTGLLGKEYIENAECFFGVYGAADSSLGAVRIVVSSNASIPHSSTTPSSTTPTTTNSPIIVPTTTSTASEAPVTFTSQTPSSPTATENNANTKVLSFVLLFIVGFLN
uniref:Uncharacterized protein n=1 Tax=Panagrolaimus superbus TaxID=310955 RepID=A0A914Z1L8_9BILA